MHAITVEGVIAGALVAETAYPGCIPGSIHWCADTDCDLTMEPKRARLLTVLCLEHSAVMHSQAACWDLKLQLHNNMET